MSFAAGLASALWLGVFTALSPCPLATNIVAVSFVGRELGSRWRSLAAGLLYAAGRSVAYIALGSLICGGVLSRPAAAAFAGRFMNELLGPVLIVLGLVLLGWIGGGKGFSLSLGGGGYAESIKARAAAGNGLLWAMPLGALFALSFCPVSAGLFFGALLPLALSLDSAFAVPAVYGAGTSLPVVAFSLVIVFCASAVGRLLGVAGRVESVVRGLAGALCVAVGIYYCIVHVFGVDLY